MQESGEMYLEAVLVLSLQKSLVRSIDVAEYLGYSKPSVSRAIGILRHGGFLSVSDGGALSLTEAGKSIADKIYQRHVVLTEFLVKLGVDRQTASRDACKIEHHISDASFEAVKKLSDNL